MGIVRRPLWPLRLRPRRTFYIAGLAKPFPKYTVHVVVGVDPKNRMFLLDLWRQQASSNVWIEAFCDLVIKWKPQFWAEEKTQITSGVGPFISSRAIERRAYTNREQFPTRGDKGKGHQGAIDPRPYGADGVVRTRRRRVVT
jgi:hypothetical protein